jgi:lysophospholipase L1-like esterase
MAAPLPAKAAPEPAVRLSRKKKLAFSTCVQLLALLGLELGARVGSYLYYGRNPYYLFFGLRSWTDEEGEGHSEKHRGYFKFPASRTITYGTPQVSCRIGNHGFRGADFAAAKPADVRRVICTGASSTFGYLDEDDETYPYYLERELETKLGPGRVQVINAGIPHSTSSNVVAMLREELLDYQPDVLTFYEGYNDASHPMAESTLQAVSRWFDEYSAAYAGLRKVVTSVAGPVLFGRWSGYLPHMDRATLERQLALHVDEWRASLERMSALAAEHGIPLVLVRQPMTLWFDRKSRGQVHDGDPRPTYEQEYAEIATKLANDGLVDDLEASLYIHHHLLEELDAFAREHSLAVVDNVALLAEQPEGLGSRIHLFPEANRRLARELAETIEPLLRR